MVVKSAGQSTLAVQLVCVSLSLSLLRSEQSTYLIRPLNLSDS